jgi:cytochrome c556
LEDSAAAHELSQQFKEVIDEHTEAAAAHHKAVMAAHENGQATMAAAIADKWDVAALKAHREAAVAHAEAATEALEKTEAASSAAQGVKETALRQLMEEVDDLTAENQDHVAAIEELQAALEQVKDGFL